MRDSVCVRERKRERERERVGSRILSNVFLIVLCLNTLSKCPQRFCRHPFTKYISKEPYFYLFDLSLSLSLSLSLTHTHTHKHTHSHTHTHTHWLTLSPTRTAFVLSWPRPSETFGPFREKNFVMFSKVGGGRSTLTLT